jgi:hypothetical protein
MVVRVGDGNSALSNAATPVFVERRYLDTVGSIVSTVAMPTAPPADDGENQILTQSGNGVTGFTSLPTGEGMLNRSVDGRFVTLAGYAAPVGYTGGFTNGVTQAPSATINRIVGRIDADGNVDTSTRMSAAFSANPVHAAITVDGTAYWVSGASSANGGIHYVALGSAGASTMLLPLPPPVNTNPTNVRGLGIFGGNLYGSSALTNFWGVFQVTGGLPTTGGQSCPQLPGMPTATGPQPYSFALFDRDDDGTFDTLYIADDRAVGSGGGIQKWILTANADGGAPFWSLSTTFNATLSVGTRGLAGLKASGGIILVATSADALANKILYYFDDGSSANPTPTAIDAGVVGAPPDGGAPAAMTQFRGVALAP